MKPTELRVTWDKNGEQKGTLTDRDPGDRNRVGLIILVPDDDGVIPPGERPDLRYRKADALGKKEFIEEAGKQRWVLSQSD